MSDDKKPTGRPSKYDPDVFPRIAAAMARLGATDSEIADELGVVKSTFYLWRSKHKAFSDALKVGKAPADDRVEASLYRRAVGYEIDTVKVMQFQGEPVVIPYREYIHPDTTAAIFWLKNRRPEAWRQNPEGGESETDKLAEALNNIVDKLPGA